MTVSDTQPLVRPADVAAATGLLTRLPVKVDIETATKRGASAAWAYPIVGAIVGAIVSLISLCAIWIGTPITIAAAIGLASGVIITGAMHEDGLADTADGLWGGWDAARRLEIMKDSHIGAYGVIALVLSLLIRWLILSTLLAAPMGWAMIIVLGMVSRAAMVGLMAWLPNARAGGLSQTVGRPSTPTAAIAAIIGGFAAIGFIGMEGVLAAVVAVAITGICGLIARTKIGGQTGDILGATQQITEMTVGVALICCLAL